jgi:hypothetical protein
MIIHNDESSPCLPILEERYNSNVIPRHDTVEYIVLILHIGSVDGDVCDIDDLLVKQYVLASLVKCCTAIHILGVLFGHGFRSRSRPVNTFVVCICQFHAEVLLEILVIDFLKTNNVRILGRNLLQNLLFSEVPCQRSRGCVAILLGSSSLFAEDIV